MQTVKHMLAAAVLLPLPFAAAADPSLPPALVPLSAERSLTAIARLRPANETQGGCTAVLIAPDVALTAAHCAGGAVAGPAAMRLTFGPDDAPSAFRVTVRAVAFHAGYGDGAVALDTAHTDLAILRLAMPVPPEIATPLALGTGDTPGNAAIYGFARGETDSLRGHPTCRLLPMAPGILGSDCAVVSGLSGSAVLSGRPGNWRLEGIAVATVAGDPMQGFPLRSVVADVVPWPGFAGPYALAEPPEAAASSSAAQTSP